MHTVPATPGAPAQAEAAINACKGAVIRRGPVHWHRYNVSSRQHHLRPALPLPLQITRMWYQVRVDAETKGCCTDNAHLKAPVALEDPMPQVQAAPVQPPPGWSPMVGPWLPCVWHGSVCTQAAGSTKLLAPRGICMAVTTVTAKAHDRCRTRAHQLHQVPLARSASHGRRDSSVVLYVMRVSLAVAGVP